MIIGVIIIFIITIFGILTYYSRPKWFMLYWISVYPFVLPLFYLIFKPALTPILVKFQPILRYYPVTLLLLMFFLFLKSPGVKKIHHLYIPISLLIIFLFFQNVYVGLNFGCYFKNILDILYNIAPFLFIIANKKVRPSRELLIRYFVIFVYIQVFFSLLNLLGFRIYGTMKGGFDDHLISGSFMRYNHMTNYLVVFFFIISYEYNQYKSLSKRNYFIISSLVGMLIILSGSRMTLLLYSFCLFYYILMYQNIKIVILSIVGGVLVVSTYIIGNTKFAGMKADEGSGFERNAIGIINLANSDKDISEGNTLALSAYLLIEKFNSPIVGNGKVYRDDYYGVPGHAQFTAGIFKADARFAFMLVEYGIIGLSLFFLLFFSILKSCHKYSAEHSLKLYIGSIMFYLLFSITDEGYWDRILFSVLYIYAFSTRVNVILENRNVGEIKKNRQKQYGKNRIITNSIQ